LDLKKLIVLIIFFIFGGLSISYYIGLISYTPNMSFSRFWLILGIVLIVMGFFYLKFDTKLLSYIPKKFLIIFTSFLIIGFSFFLVTEAFIYKTGTEKDNTPTDYVVVLGAGLIGDRISTSLQLRLDAALEFHSIHPEIPIIVSGGQGPDELLSEARAMKDYLIEKGIDPNLITMEDKSTSTYENFMFSKELISNKCSKTPIKVTVITNNFHQFRANMIAKAQGFEVHGYPGSCHPYSSLNFHVREFPGVIKSFIFDR